MRTTNVDTLSALIDRLICERIKLYFFEKDNRVDSIVHQKEVIYDLKSRISDLFIECFESNGYKYIGERRTFDEKDIVESIDQLVISDVWIGEGDRARLSEITGDDPCLATIVKFEKITRKANESRAKYKNFIDLAFAKLFGKWRKKQS